MSENEDLIKEKLTKCRLCPRSCGVNRYKDERGECQIGRHPIVASYSLHFGEEPPLVGSGGSGTIFFSGCNLHCVFCQNYEISQLCEGSPMTEEQICEIMLQLQSRGAHNINFVSPTHVAVQILVALRLAREKGLTLPAVYNSGGYDSIETLKMFDGEIQIYMPDAKYADAANAEKYSAAKNYPLINREALKEMHRQVGDLILDKSGVAKRGLLVRHLVMPAGIAGSRGIIDFVADEISPKTYFNLMAQWRPCYKAGNYKELDSGIDPTEFVQLYYYAKKKGLRVAR